MSLLNLSANTEALIQGFRDDLPPRVQCRLQELGFQEGQKVRCLRRIPFGGPNVFLVGDTVYSLGADVAAQVLVSAVS
jgi:Fe2+ transport system protein FeoA